ncbi:MAG: hypothetical protein ACR2PW_04525 [Gammaproteobacteria bacterium]
MFLRQREKLSLFGACCHKSGGDTFNAPAPQPINQQQLINQQAKANRVDVRSPFGTALFSGPQRRELDIELSPEQQAILGQQQRAQTNVGDIALSLIGQFPGQAINFEGLPQLPGLDDFGEERQRVEQAFFDRTLGLLNPEFERQQRGLEQSLQNRGIPLGSEIRGEEFDVFNTSRNEALSRAAQDAVAAGGAEQNRLFGLSQAARQQGIAERQALRAGPLAEIAALLGQQQVQQPTFLPPGQVDVIGPAQLASNQQLGLFGLGQQQQLQQAQLQQSGINALIGAGGQLGGAGLLSLGGGG